MKKNTMISVEALTKSFKTISVLDGISFTVEKGNIFALLGSNGAGKTTTIKILTTLLKPDSGIAKVCEIDVTEQPEQVRESISLTGQFAAVDEVLTGRENMYLIGKLRHLPDVKQKSDELLQRFDLTDAADRYVSTYSGGMRRRLDLAMSLLGSPAVLFLDEPTTGLDPQARTVMWKIIKELASKGVTIFLTTQYLEEADQLADQVAILHQGKIVAEGSAAELKRMLPHGHIELRFLDETILKEASDLLTEFKQTVDEESQALSVVTDGSVKQMTEILTKLEKNHVTVLEFAQKLPTLDDVFISIVNNDQGVNSK